MPFVDVFNKLTFYRNMHQRKGYQGSVLDADLLSRFFNARTKIYALSAFGLASQEAI
jgi:hypothetical protein